MILKCNRKIYNEANVVFSLDKHYVGEESNGRIKVTDDTGVESSISASDLLDDGAFTVIPQ